MKRLLDLFCGAGGCSVGYALAGFDVTGVDIEPHPDYPYQLIVADALDVLADSAFLAGFDVVHASPPCPRYSVATPAASRSTHPDLVGPVRAALTKLGVPWVIENVPGAPMPGAVTLCGAAMGLRHIRRHRLFESSVFLMAPGCACPTGDTVSVFGNGGEDRRKTTRAANGGAPRLYVPVAELRALMGVEWMSRRADINDAIPPAYTEFVGAQMQDHLAGEAARC